MPGRLPPPEFARPRSGSWRRSRRSSRRRPMSSRSRSSPGGCVRMSWSRSYPGVSGADGPGDQEQAKHAVAQGAPRDAAAAEPMHNSQVHLKMPSRTCMPQRSAPLTSRPKSRRNGEDCLGLRLRSLLPSPPWALSAPPSGRPVCTAWSIRRELAAHIGRGVCGRPPQLASKRQHASAGRPLAWAAGAAAAGPRMRRRSAGAATAAVRAAPREGQPSGASPTAGPAAAAAGVEQPEQQQRRPSLQWQLRVPCRR